MILQLKMKDLDIKNLKQAKGIKKYIGLMFKKNPEPLAFILKKEKKIAINSLFCKVDFIALWFDKADKLIDAKLIKPGQLKILPKKSFKTLVEIPMVNKNGEIK